jgi:hypothetical protein
MCLLLLYLFSTKNNNNNEKKYTYTMYNDMQDGKRNPKEKRKETSTNTELSY